ncbi:Endo-1,4-beta-xylanase F3 [Psilocybe cubensis]|uniref:Endo-1,4-beta-xylanase F3 n=1 Tax=Psilocybe cubensis TaxID=181762 RepID=A0ACB8H7E9_PSICU|nr:Endo-1,4-beta-xylanase F3 [Psilocybe cubensis]KAH9483607.1 Endo-1,4-beta-xylanase F3 [Psilocybe cubensis]
MSKLLAFVTIAVIAQQVTAVAVWGQCDSGSVCTYSNPYYSQCLPGSATTPPTSTPATTSSPATSTTPSGGGSSGSGLNGKFVSHGKVFWGSCADSNTLNIAANAAILKSDFGAVTPWDATESQQGQFNFGGSDALVNWAVSNGKMIRGHNFIWHEQLPSWVTSINNKATLTSVMQKHISTLGGRYAGKIYVGRLQVRTSLFHVSSSSDNDASEILNEDGSLRSSVWSNVFGESFVQLAFQYARTADPKAKLYINDYNLDSNNAKTQGMVALVKRVNANGNFIDGIGTQMHLSAGGAGGAQAALTALASTGLDVAITELDIANASSNDYTTVVKACLNTPKCVTITSWGVSDTNSWRASTNPLLFDGNYKPKAAYNAIISLL